MILRRNRRRRLSGNKISFVLRKYYCSPIAADISFAKLLTKILQQPKKNYDIYLYVYVQKKYS